MMPLRDFTNDNSALALNTATLGALLDGYGAGWPVEKVIDACAEHGLGGIVFWRREIGNRSVEIGDRVRAAGMQVVGLCRSPFLVGPLALPTHQQIIDDFHAAIDMAAGLQASVITIVVGGVEPGTKGIENSLKLATERVAEVAPYARKRGVKLALEPLHPVYGGDRSCLVTMRDAVNICEEIDQDNVGVAADVYHVWWDTSLAEELQRAGKKRVFGYHVCDWLADTKDVLLDRGMMGDGVVDLKGLRKAVEQAGYDGFCEVEIFSENNWWKRDPDEVIATCVDRFRRFC